MQATDIELTIARTMGGAATVALRVELPGRRADLAEGAPIDLDDARLLSMLTRPAMYGASLSEMVLAGLAARAVRAHMSLCWR